MITELDNEGSHSLRHGYASVNGIRLHYAEAGYGEDLVILLHGFPEFWYSWRHQLAALSGTHHAVAPDLRGYNLSDRPPRTDDYRMDLLVEDVVGLIDHFGAAKAAIVGHDWGAGIAWALAERHPERVSKIAVLQVPPAAAWRANMTLRQLLRSWYMLLFQLPRLPEWIISRNNFAAVDKMFTETVGRKGSFTPADIKLYKEALRRRGALTAGLNYYRANASRLSPREKSKPSGGETQRDRRIRVPTLFIFGEQDEAIVPETVRGLERFISGPYQELRLPDSGHWVQNEAADEVNRALIEFLSEGHEVSAPAQ